MMRTIRGLTAGLAVAALAGCAAQPATPAGAGARPALVAFLVVDGLPQWQVVGYRDQLAPDGLRRFLDRGAWFADAHYGHAFTVTASGHATMLTGTYAHRHGIIGNDWRDPATGEVEYCTQDDAHQYLGHRTGRHDGTSPKNLRVETLGDVLRTADARSKVIGISGKDRGAILPAGHKGTAYMYMAQTGQFASTTYYMKEHPGWVTRFHEARPAEAYFGREWRPLLDDAAYGKSLPDGQAWFARGGQLPKRLGAGSDEPGPAYFGALGATPFMDELTLAFARAAIEGEALGRDDAPDILAVSLSTHDYVNHAYGAESRISHDHVLQLDRILQEFFRYLDATVGRDRYVVVLTSDHGFMPVPEHSRTLGREAGRVSPRELVARMNAALAPRFGEGAWVKALSAQGLLLDRRLAAAKGIDAAALAEAARAALVAEPGVAVAYTRAELESGRRVGAPFFEAMRVAFHPARSPDVLYALEPYWIVSSSRTGTTHGSPHPYDTHVPMLFYGPRWIAPGRVGTRAEVADIAPTLAKVLGVSAPAASEGRVLPILARP